MKKSTSILSRLFRATTGQDLVEYALMTIFVAVAALTIMPGVSKNMERIFKKINCSMENQDIREVSPSEGLRSRFACVVRTGGQPR